MSEPLAIDEHCFITYMKTELRTVHEFCRREKAVNVVKLNTEIRKERLIMFIFFGLL